MLLVHNKKEKLYIYVDCEPKTAVKNPRHYSKKEMKKPYINKERALFTIFFEGEQYTILCEKGYDWDGASIPFGFRWIIGAKGSPEFLTPSMVHDKMCENHELVGHNRHLSSLIFRELLIAYKVSPIKANIMFGAVDNFQKLCGWREKE